MFRRTNRVSGNAGAFQCLTNNSLQYDGKFEKTKKMLMSNLFSGDFKFNYGK